MEVGGEAEEGLPVPGKLEEELEEEGRGVADRMGAGWKEARGRGKGRDRASGRDVGGIGEGERRWR